MKQELKEDRDPSRDFVDHSEDETNFEVSIVNKRNECLNIDCSMHNGQI